MNITLLLALVAVIVGFVLAVKKNEYSTGTFWLIVSMIILLVLPQVISFHA